VARGDPNIQGSYSSGLPSGGYRQPNVQPYMGNLLASRYGGGGYGGAAGYGQTDPRKKKMDELLAAAGRKPGLDPITDPALAGLDQTGPGGEVPDPERLFNIRGRGSTPYDRMQNIAAAADRYRGVSRNVGGVSRGFGFGNPEDLFRKLIMQRLGGGL